MNKYSVVFMPDAATIEIIKQMKLQLADKTGWFNSKNSLAHFTVFEFLEDDTNIQQVEKQLKRIASGIKPFDVLCDSFDYFDNGAFYTKPNKSSTEKMRSVMKVILAETNNIKKTITNTTPHLTIGRRLSSDQLQTAQKIFTEIHLSFEIQYLTLRRFDEKIRQFVIYRDFPLLGNSKEIQGSLF